MAGMIPRQSTLGDGYVAPVAPAGVGNLINGGLSGASAMSGKMSPMSQADTNNISTSGVQGGSAMDRLIKALRG